MDTYKQVKHPFQALFDLESRVLILGSFPSPKSREEGFFYAHPQNRFWKVLAAVWEEAVPKSIKEKQDFCHRHHLALWDVIYSCSIKGAEDASIKDVVVNDVASVCCRAPIAAVFTTGKEATRLYDEHLSSQTGFRALGLPSPSSANAKMSFEDLVEAYKAIRLVAEGKTSCCSDPDSPCNL